ncbi:sulfatase family protein [Lacibacter sp.]|uniref:sulfatase family protein n=1 Tax=Lacibacter sp. TaxID=1915409 RepID=UPI002B4AF886|nr:sulfatase-like hydrolase/transferase [Lacibacter sp.]HLP37700.1 sulfatase-like hydrolase/transferase [Lacibacter sp.]
MRNLFSRKFLLLPGIFTSIFCHAQTRPNIIFILTDDMGYGDVSCYNGTYQTPNIDAMAAEGIRFTNYYSAAPVCSPSRVGFMTGVAPAKYNITNYLHTKQHNKNCEQKDFLDAQAPNIARLFQNNGYSTAHFGKWHMGGGRDVTNAPHIKEYGFDEWSSTWESPNPDSLLTDSNWIWSNTDSIKRWNRTAYFVDKTIAFLKKNNNKPCFINLWPDDVHIPWVSGDADVRADFAKEKNFIPVLNEYDKQIGRLIQFLKQSGLDKNTIVVFTSDNGPAPNFRNDRSAGMRGAKVSLYEGGIRMPLIIWYPSKIKKPAVDTSSVLTATDLLSSFAAIANIKHKYETDGVDRSSVLLGKPSERKKEIFWEYGRNNNSFGYPAIAGGRSPQLAIREGKWKLLMNADGSSAELYDLLNDKNETTNLFEKERVIAQKLSEQLMKWWKGLPSLK